MTKVKITVNHVFGKFTPPPCIETMPIYRLDQVVDVDDDVAEIFLANGQAVLVEEEPVAIDEDKPVKRRGRLAQEDEVNA
jgi:hypothetical protein